MIHTADAGPSHRSAMIEPNVYWTLDAPFATIVGLYTNVPSDGAIKAPQAEWLANELKSAPADKALIIAMHHPIYSADDHHSGSSKLKIILDTAIANAGRRPDLIMAAHVNNYQRITKKYSFGGQSVFLVVGAGGYRNLHHIAMIDGRSLVPPVTFKDEDVTLESYSDDHHGFLRLEINDRTIIGRYYTVPRPQEADAKADQLYDSFEYDWRSTR